MKRIILIIIIISFLLTGCQNKLKENNIIVEEKNEIKEEYIDSNPIKLGLYMYKNKNTPRKKLEEYITNWELNKDLCSLEVYYTNEQELPINNQKELWNAYYNEYENIDNYNIGYQIEFETLEGKINKYILSPKDTEEIFEYIQIYLYDDINQTASWYSHITEEEYTDNNILTSIKLTGSTLIDNITSDIKLTVFTYDEDDFDEEGTYRGISKSTIIIKRN